MEKPTVVAILGIFAVLALLWGERISAIVLGATALILWIGVLREGRTAR